MRSAPRRGASTAFCATVISARIRSLIMGVVANIANLANNANGYDLMSAFYSHYLPSSHYSRLLYAMPSFFLCSISAFLSARKIAEMRRLLLFTARPRNLRLRISISTPLWRTRLENRKRALFGDSPSFFLISIIDVTKLRIIYEYTNLCSSADSYSSYVFVCLHF